MSRRADPRVNPRYCPACGGDRFERRVPRRDDKERPVCVACGYVHYVGPVLAAGAILHDGKGRVCLVRRAHDPGLGRWSFAGGFVDLGETPEEAALRETQEETGCHAVIEKLVGAYRSRGPKGKEVVIVVYSACLEDRGATSCEEVDEVKWFAADAIPWDDFAFESSVAALRKFLG